MALNLGDINFGLGVDTRRLSKSTNDVVKFGRTVEQTASKSSAASKKAAGALRRQEKAALSALQQTLRFNEQVRKAGAPSRLLTASAKSFRELSAEMTRGTRTALDYQRAQQKFTTNMGTARRSLDRFKAKTQQTGAAVDSFSSRIRNLTSASILAVGPLSGVGARITALGSIANRSNIALAGIIGGVTAAGLAMSKLGAAAVRTNLQLARVRIRLDTLSGSTAQAAQEFERLQSLADNTGTNFVSLANNFTKVASAAQGTSLEGEGVRKVFDDIVFSAAKFQLEAEQVTGVLRAVEQIMSKGTVQAEELRGQLGDRLPGAFQIAARAIGVTTARLNEMLKNGEVLSEEFLPKFARELRRSMGAEGVTRITSLQASIGRLGNAATDFNDTLDRTLGISQAFQASVELLTGSLMFLTNNMDTLALVAGAVAGAFLALAGPRIISGFIALLGLIRSVTVAVFGLNAAILANPIGGLATILTRVAVASVGAVVGFSLVSAAISETDNKQQNLIRTIDEYIEAQKNAGRAASTTTGKFKESLQEEVDAVQARIDELRTRYTRNIPQQASVSADTRSGLQRFIDDAQRRTREILQLQDTVDEGVIKFLKARADADRLAEGELAQLQTRMQELTRIQREQAEIEKQKADAQRASLNAATAGADRQIQRIRDEAAAIGESAGAVQALKAEFQQADAIERFRKSLARAKVEAELITTKTAEFAAAMDTLREVQQGSVLESTAKRIADINREIQAIGDGPQAVQALKTEFANNAAIEAFRQSLIAVNVETAVIDQRVAAFTASIQQLNAVTAQVRIDEAIAKATAEVAKLNSEAQALRTGEEAVRRLKEEFARTEAIENFRQRLEEAGVQASMVEGLVRNLTGALLGLAAAANQTRIDAALTNASDALSNIRRETDALRGGKDVFRAFQNARTVEQSVANLAKNLNSAGVAEDVITARVSDHRTAMEALIAQRTRYNASLRTGGKAARRSASATQKITQEIDTVKRQTQQLIALQNTLANSGNFEALETTFKVTEQVERYRDRLERAGVAQGVINQKVEEFRNALTVYEGHRTKVEELKKAYEGASNAIQEILDRQALLANINPIDLAQGFSFAEKIAEYRLNLEKLGLAQEVVNQRTSEFKQKLIELSAEEARLKNIADIFKNVQQSIESGFDSLADSLADSLVEGKLSLKSLADIGKQVAKELIANFLKLAIIKPMLGSVFGGFGGGGGGGGFGGLFSGTGGNFFGSLFGRQGLAFAGGAPTNVNRFRQGGILSAPTLFSTGSGPAIGGEAGDEAILPLVRSSSGNLGVQSMGGGSSVINFNFPPGTDATSFRKSESQMAALASRIATRGNRNL